MGQSIEGTLQGDVVARGDLAKPQITGEVTGRDLRIAELQVARFSSELRLGGKPTDELFVNVEARDVVSGETEVQGVRLLIEGTNEQHNLSLSGDNELVAVRVGAAGSLQGLKRWEFLLSSLELDILSLIHI